MSGSMRLFASLAALAALASASMVSVTPIEKVITLLTDMKDAIVTEAKDEATTYEKFACFCKDTTTAKSTSVKDGNDKIDSLSADIADKTASKEKDSTDLLQRKAKQEKLSADLAAEKARCAKEKAEYQASEADVSKAISSLKNAIKAMEASKPAAASLLQGSVKDELTQTLAMADAMNLIAAPKRKVITSMLQGKVDPSNPEYGFHSNDIVDLLKNLETDFKGQKSTLDSEWAKTKKGCEETQAGLSAEMVTNSDAIEALTKNIAKFAKEIAQHRGDLVESQADMKDDELYLKDLTARCETRAHDWDQRSSMRNDEISAMTQALKILTNNVKGAADEVNQRALLQRFHKPEAAPVAKPAAAPTKPAQKDIKKVSFLQGFLGRSMTEETKDKAISLLLSEGQRLGSVVLTSLAQRSAGDPFDKVKGLIQKLIERLLAESAAEATKKGFCDTELGKARKDRAFRRSETKDLSADLESLEAKEDALTEEIKTLTGNLKVENEVLKTTTEERQEQKEENMKTLKTAKEGLSAVQEALLTLKVFYKQAAKASFLQASPVDEDTTGAGFSGSYSGNQSGSKAVFALLETIASDFDRTIRTTEKQEEAAHRDFVEFVQATKSSIGSKTTKKELDEQDLRTTRTSLETKMNDLQTAQNLLDDALRELEELKPTCIDTGMSYAERVEKREEEIKALKNALLILAPSP